MSTRSPLLARYLLVRFLLWAAIVSRIRRHHVPSPRLLAVLSKNRCLGSLAGNLLFKESDAFCIEYYVADLKLWWFAFAMSDANSFAIEVRDDCCGQLVWSRPSEPQAANKCGGVWRGSLDKSSALLWSRKIAVSPTSSVSSGSALSFHARGVA